MNCRRRGAASALKPKDQSKPGNGVKTYGDKALMERHMVEKRPYWQDPPAVIDSDTK